MDYYYLLLLLWNVHSRAQYTKSCVRARAATTTAFLALVTVRAPLSPPVCTASRIAAAPTPTPGALHAAALQVGSIRCDRNVERLRRARARVRLVRITAAADRQKTRFPRSIHTRTHRWRGAVRPQRRISLSPTRRSFAKTRASTVFILERSRCPPPPRLLRPWARRIDTPAARI